MLLDAFTCDKARGYRLIIPRSSSPSRRTRAPRAGLIGVHTSGGAPNQTGIPMMTASSQRILGVVTTEKTLLLLPTVLRAMGCL
jgi:hypothetical protein